jgi:hypothetical protein
MGSWKKVITSGSDANLKTLVVSQSVTAESFTGSLYGTASYSYTEFYVTYSYITQSLAVTASYSTSSSYTDDGPFFRVKSACDTLGTEVILSNLKARISSTNSASIQLRTVSGSMTVDGMQPGGFNTVNQVTRIEGLELSTTYTYVDVNTNMENPGDSQVFTFVDRNLGVSYRVTGLVSQGFTKNLISIEKLV